MERKQWPSWVRNASPTPDDLRDGYRRVNVEPKPKRHRRAAWQTAKYVKHLESPEWHAFRVKCFVLARYQCARCSKPAENLHHLHYATLGAETVDDVEPLCSDCHAREHGGANGNLFTNILRGKRATEPDPIRSRPSADIEAELADDFARQC